MSKEGGVKVSKEGDGGVKVSKEGSGGVKVSKEGDGGGGLNKGSEGGRTTAFSSAIHRLAGCVSRVGSRCQGQSRRVRPYLFPV